MNVGYARNRDLKTKNCSIVYRNYYNKPDPILQKIMLVGDKNKTPMLEPAAHPHFSSFLGDQNHNNNEPIKQQQQLTNNQQKQR
jgi:hypothetical protein